MVVRCLLIKSEIQAHNNRDSFYINLPIGGAVFLIFVLFFRTPKLSKPAEATWKEILVQVNPIGVFAILGAVVCYLLAMQWGGLTRPWHDSSVIGTLVGFGVIALSFLLLQYLMARKRFCRAG